MFTSGHVTDGTGYLCLHLATSQMGPAIYVYIWLRHRWDRLFMFTSGHVTDGTGYLCLHLATSQMGPAIYLYDPNALCGLRSLFSAVAYSI